MSDGSIRIDIDNDNQQTDRAFIVSSDNANKELLIVEETGKVKIGDVLNLQIHDNLPTSNLENGDVILLKVVSNSVVSFEMKIYYSGSWLDL